MTDDEHAGESSRDVGDIERQTWMTREHREHLRMLRATCELAKVAPETAAIVEGWARAWRPSDAR